MNKLSCFLLHVSGPLAAKVWQLFACSVACRAAIRNLSIPSIRFCLFGMRCVPFCMISLTHEDTIKYMYNHFSLTVKVLGYVCLYVAPRRAAETLSICV